MAEREPHSAVDGDAAAQIGNVIFADAGLGPLAWRHSAGLHEARAAWPKLQRARLSRSPAYVTLPSWKQKLAGTPIVSPLPSLLLLPLLLEAQWSRSVAHACPSV